MKILVCIKQVDDIGNMNRFDTFALEEALVLKDAFVENDNKYGQKNIKLGSTFK